MPLVAIDSCFPGWPSYFEVVLAEGLEIGKKVVSKIGKRNKLYMCVWLF